MHAIHYQISDESVFTFVRAENPNGIVMRLGLANIERHQGNVSKGQAYAPDGNNVGESPRFGPINAEGLQSLSLQGIVSSDDRVDAIDCDHRSVLSSFDKLGN